jgi:coproporphyrinogen III oxidase-like Fe-S oxidoreductase
MQLPQTVEKAKNLQPETLSAFNLELDPDSSYIPSALAIPNEI